MKMKFIVFPNMCKIEILKDEENPFTFFSKIEQTKSKKKINSEIECIGESFTKSEDILNSHMNKATLQGPTDQVNCLH